MREAIRGDVAAEVAAEVVARGASRATSQACRHSDRGGMGTLPFTEGIHMTRACSHLRIADLLRYVSSSSTISAPSPLCSAASGRALSSSPLRTSIRRKSPLRGMPGAVSSLHGAVLIIHGAVSSLHGAVSSLLALSVSSMPGAIGYRMQSTASCIPSARRIRRLSRPSHPSFTPRRIRRLSRPRCISEAAVEAWFVSGASFPRAIDIRGDEGGRHRRPSGAMREAIRGDEGGHQGR